MSEEAVEKAIEEIMENFKFELVYAYMNLVGWRYWNSDQTPSINTLKETAERLLRDCKKKHGCGMRSGGFEVDCHNEEGCGMSLELKFVPLSSQAYLE